MYKFPKAFDTAQHPDSAGGQRLNIEGDFPLSLVSLDKMKTSTGKEALELKFRVIDGPHAGNLHSEMFFLWLPEEKKRQYSVQLLAGVCRALNGGADGQFTGPDLIGKKCMVTRVEDGVYNGYPQYKSHNWRSLSVLEESVRRAQPAAQPAPAEEDDDTPFDDDIPF